MLPSGKDFQTALCSPAWTDVLKPWLTERLAREQGKLVSGCVRGVEPLQLVSLGTRVAMFHYFLTEPEAIVKKMLNEQDAAAEALEATQKLSQIDADNAAMLEYGRNPFTLTGQPGEPHGDET